MRVPVDVATHETFNFVTSYVPSGATMLEVGCGEGELAAELQRVGYHVVGLESDLERAALTARRGVPSVLAAWPAFESAAAFDAIAFTRSLHHIDPLRDAVRQAWALLKPGGTLLLEEFAVEGVGPSDLKWFREVLQTQTARSLILPAPDEFVSQLLDAADPFELWSERHDHVHSFATIESEIQNAFWNDQVSSVPYFYRYLVYVLPESPPAVEFIEAVFQEESGLVAAGEITGLGRRIVGSPRGIVNMETMKH